MFLIRAFNRISELCVSGLLKKNDPLISLGFFIFFTTSIAIGIRMIYVIANGGGQVESTAEFILALSIWSLILFFFIQVFARAGYEIWKDFYQEDDFPKD